MSTAISIRNVSKKYVIGKQKDGSLRGTLGGMFSKKEHKTEEFWALNDVSFDIQQGDVVGIIGKNGAGKSTLLKILSQITKPTTGSIEINGRVASLLEVGTGFHPELTGRENVYLNGTILGMTRNEVKAKFDEIVAFSGVEKFIDTPVKHYSSGMYVRLAFAVAAHLEPEILIIDEVLAVGDASFQKKCLGKMKEVAGKGRTVIFVSHDISAVSSLCNKGILLDKGLLIKNDEINKVIDSYISSSSDLMISCKKYSIETQPKENDGNIELISFQLINNELNPIVSFFVDESAYFEVKFKVKNNIDSFPIPNFHFTHATGGKLFVSVNSIQENMFSSPGEYISRLKIPQHFFNAGHFNVGLAISSFDPLIIHVSDYNAISFDVIDKLNSETRNGYTGKMDGFLRPLFEWDNCTN